MAGAVFQITEDSTAATGYLVGDTVQLQQGANVSCVLTCDVASPAHFVISAPEVLSGESMQGELQGGKVIVIR
jgi:hypothetical protein